MGSGFLTSFEVVGPSLHALALVAFGDILYLAAVENSLHLDLTAAWTVEMMGAARASGVLGNLCHGLLLAKTR